MSDSTPEQLALKHTEPREEFFENTATDVEVEEVEDLDITPEQSGETRPWDPSKIRISTKPFSLRQVVDMIDDGDIDLAPDFQRLSVWTPMQRWRLIESILLGIPLPAFYFNQDATGAMQVVDGVQRLTTIHGFATKSSHERLAHQEYLKHLNNKRFADLDAVLRRRFQQTQIFVNVIEPQTPDEVKFDVFRRINTGGTPLTAQEIRHCMSRARSRDLLRRLVGLPSFARATAGALAGERRMADREMALRFCAFRLLPDIEAYREFPSLDSFLLDSVRQIDGTHKTSPPIPEAILERLVHDFDQAMHSAAVVFGKCAFRKYPTSASQRGPINRALFESWAVALADYTPEFLLPHATKIMTMTRNKMEDYDYNTATTQGTGDFQKVKLRFTAAREIIRIATR